jgi:hypothetical protein
MFFQDQFFSSIRLDLGKAKGCLTNPFYGLIAGDIISIIGI